MNGRDDQDERDDPDRSSDPNTETDNLVDDFLLPRSEPRSDREQIKQLLAGDAGQNPQSWIEFGGNVSTVPKLVRWGVRCTHMGREMHPSHALDHSHTHRTLETNVHVHTRPRKRRSRFPG